MHRKNGSKRPTSEWIIVENAHQALISAEEAKGIAEARSHQRRQKAFDTGYHRSRISSYLLTGGLFKCERCGANMIGFRKSDDRRYYTCGSEPYRRGLGCGPGVYVPQGLLEEEVIKGIGELQNRCIGSKSLVREVNEELKQIWEANQGYDLQAAQKLTAVDKKIANIRGSIEEGLTDTAWANGRLTELTRERNALASIAAPSGDAPQIDLQTALAYRKDTARLLAHGKPEERKQLVRTWVQEIKLAPERLEVEITYRLPEPVMNTKVAGARFVPDYYADTRPLMVAHWIYAPAKQGTREMRRVGLAA